MSSGRNAGRVVLSILLAGVWVNLCEFVRNQFLLASQWRAHFAGMGLVFPAQPVNGALWMVWAFIFAAMVFVVSRRFGIWQTTFIAWVMGFVLMWLVIGNLLVLPLSILPVAIPFSFVEALGAAFISRRLGRLIHNQR